MGGKGCDHSVNRLYAEDANLRIYIRSHGRDSMTLRVVIVCIETAVNE